MATRQTARTRTPSFRSCKAADHLRCCQPARHSFATAAAIASVERPDSFTDAQHGGCRRHPGVPCHDVLDGWSTRCILVFHEERLCVQGMRRRPVHPFERLLHKTKWRCRRVGLRMRECPRILFLLSACAVGAHDHLLMLQYGLSLIAPRSDVSMCSSNCCYGYSMLSADKSSYDRN